MDRQETITWLLDNIRNNPLYSSVGFWAPILEQMTDEELSVMVDIELKGLKGQVHKEDLKPILPAISRILMDRDIPDCDDSNQDDGVGGIFIGLN